MTSAGSRLAVVLVLAAMVVPATAGVTTAGEITAAVKGGAVSLRADDASLRSVLALLAEKARLSLRIHGDLDRHVSVRVDGVPLEAVLGRLVPEGHVLTEDRLIVFLTAPRPNAPPALASATPAAGPVTVIAGDEGRAEAFDTGSVVPGRRETVPDAGVSTPAVGPARSPSPLPSPRRGAVVTAGAPSGGFAAAPQPRVVAEVDPDEANRLAARVDAHLAAPSGLDAAESANIDAIARSVQQALP